MFRSFDIWTLNSRRKLVHPASLAIYPLSRALSAGFLRPLRRRKRPPRTSSLSSPTSLPRSQCCITHRPIESLYVYLRNSIRACGIYNIFICADQVLWYSCSWKRTCRVFANRLSNILLSFSFAISVSLNLGRRNSGCSPRLEDAVCSKEEREREYERSRRIPSHRQISLEFGTNRTL